MRIEMDLREPHSLKGIIFDFDNTLVDTKGASLVAIEEVKAFLDSLSLSKDSAAIVQNFEDLLKSSEKDPDGIILIDEWRTNLWLKAIGDETKNDLAKTLYQLWKTKRLEAIFLSEEIKALLSTLKESYKILLLTNGDPQVQREKLDQCSGWDYFDIVMISGDFECEKPDPTIFEVALKKLETRRKETIIVGDSLSTDIQGGLNAGLLATVWVHPEHQSISCVDPKPDFQINSVLELNVVLQNLNTE